jgi:hypothetical protein
MKRFLKILFRIGSLIAVPIAAYWYVQERSPESLFTFVSVIVAFIGSFLVDNPQVVTQRDTSAEDANIRRDLLKAVGDEFTSRLEQMLTDDIRAELRLDYTPEAVQHKEWLNKTGLPPELSADAHIVTIFEKAQRKLLIIGEPGAGKTTTLVRLGAELIKQVKTDDSLPVPVLFELSRWKSGQTMRDWLAAELKDRYALTIERWLEWLNPAHPRILPLLDGFDEVPESLREECANAINVFAYNLPVKLAVCCRVTEYSLLQTKLDKVNALQIQELGEAQITHYLEAMGSDTVGLRAVLMYDSDLLDMAKSPLLLNTLIMAYRGEGEVTDFEGVATEGERHKALFAGYIKTRLKNKQQLFPEHFRYAEKFKAMNPLHQRFIKHFRSAEIEYDDADTRNWLGWLAWQMEEDEKMQVFPIDDLQADSLTSEIQQKKYRRYTQLAGDVAGGVAFGLGFGVAFTGQVDMVFGIDMGVAFGGIFGGQVGIAVSRAFNRDKWGFIKPVERLRWSTRAALSRWRTHAAGGVILSVALGLAFGGIFDVGGGGIFGLAGGMAFSVALILNDGFASEDIINKTRPNEGIYQSLKNVVRSSLPYGLLFGLVFGVAFGTIGKLGSMGESVLGSMVGSEVFGGAFGVATGLYWSILFQGGIPFLRHVALREILWRNGYAPYNYARFLDYCVRLRLLVRVGGSYKFMHRLLQEHFAAEYQASQAKNVQ